MIISILAVIGVIALLVLYLNNYEEKRDRKEADEANIRKLIEYGEKSNELWWKYQQSLRGENPMCTKDEIFKRLRIIINDPQEKRIIESNIEKAQEIEVESKKRMEKHERERMRVYYLYHEMIYEIFNSRKEMTEFEIVEGISSLKNIVEPDAEKIFNDCRVFLIEKCEWNNNYKIVNEFFKNILSDDNDGFFTYEDWLHKNDKILQEMSEDEIVFEKLRETDRLAWKNRYYSNLRKPY